MRLRPGRRLPFLKKGDDPKFLQVNFANLFIALFNALMNLRINNGKFLISDDAMAIEVAESESGDTPTNVTIKRAVITSVAGDAIQADQWNEAANDYSGGSVNIAKPPEFRDTLLSSTEYGVALTFGSHSADGNQREATYDDHEGSPATVVQRVFPPYREGEEIWFSDTTEKSGVSTYTRIEVLPCRAWWTETEGCDDEGNPLYTFTPRSPWRSTAEGSSFA